jgi:hypothetical protein
MFAIVPSDRVRSCLVMRTDLPRGRDCLIAFAGDLAKALAEDYVAWKNSRPNETESAPGVARQAMCEGSMAN